MFTVPVTGVAVGKSTVNVVLPGVGLTFHTVTGVSGVAFETLKSVVADDVAYGPFTSGTNVTRTCCMPAPSGKNSTVPVPALMVPRPSTVAAAVSVATKAPARSLGVPVTLTEVADRYVPPCGSRCKDDRAWPTSKLTAVDTEAVAVAEPTTSAITVCVPTRSVGMTKLTYPGMSIVCVSMTVVPSSRRTADRPEPVTCTTAYVVEP